MDEIFIDAHCLERYNVYLFSRILPFGEPYSFVEIGASFPM